MSRRNTVEKWLGVRNPTTREIWAMGSSGSASRVAARPMRARTTNRCGGSPVLREGQILVEVLANVVGDPPQPRERKRADLSRDRERPRRDVGLVWSRHL